MTRTEMTARPAMVGRQIPEAMVRPAAPAPITLADLDGEATFYGLYREVLAPAYVRQRVDAHRLQGMTRAEGAVRGFARAAGDLVVLRNAGVPVTERRRLVNRLVDMHETMDAGTAAPDLTELRRLEMLADTHEDVVECEAYISGLAHTPAAALAHADALDRATAANQELARGLRRWARNVATGRRG